MIRAGSLFDRLSAFRSQFRRQTSVNGLIALTLMLTGGALNGQLNHDLSSLSVDDLMNVEVTSVSRKTQKVADTAAAVFVITQDDIRRSGATSIPEILRIVPGLDVARISGNSWAISARGSNGQFANKLLVMIDGRSVYTPLFSGVFWDVQDTLIEDIDRIEVIRGPGGTLWGANAVNGIINVITKHAVDTQGALATAAIGTEGSAAGGRYGGSFGRQGNYRVYGKSFDRPPSVSGVNLTQDAWTMGSAGFRADWASRGGDNFTAQGDAYRGAVTTVGAFDPNAPLADRASLNHIGGEDLQFRWVATQSSHSDTSLQMSYERTARSMYSFVLGRRTFDLDFQHHQKAGRNDVVWGAEYRYSTDSANGPAIQLVRDSNSQSIASAFLQDEFQVNPRLRLTAGTKVQYDPISRLQLQPTLRLLFRATARQTFWAAATSAVRTPSEIELNVRLNVGTFPDGTAKGGLLVLTGNPDVNPERVESYEIGYRWQAKPTMTLDATAFHNDMQSLIGTFTGRPFRDSSGRTILPVSFSNSVNGSANGAELVLTDSVTGNWNAALAYTLFHAVSIDGAGLRTHGSAPRQQLQVRSFILLPLQFELDSSAAYVGPIGGNVPAYLRVDAQLAWRPGQRWELSISGQNLLQGRHSEFAGTNGEQEWAAPVKRTVNGRITWRF